MRRSPLPWLLTLAVVAATPLATADAKPRKKSACQKLAAKHRDRSPHPRLVLAVRGDSDVGDIAACVLPRGRVRRLARWDDGLGRAGGGIVATRGYHVLISESWGDQYGGTSETLRHVDARTRRSTTIAGYGCQLHYSQPACPEGTTYGKLVLHRSGAGAIELTDLATGATSLESFDPRGALARLDAGPVDALRIEVAEIVWVRAGLERRAPLPQ